MGSAQNGLLLLEPHFCAVVLDVSDFHVQWYILPHI